MNPSISINSARFSISTPEQLRSPPLAPASPGLTSYSFNMSSTGQFSTGEIRLSSNPQSQNSKPVTFPKSFVAPPRIALGLNSLDIGNKANARIRAYTSDISKSGFTAHVDSWADTTLYAGGFSYLTLSPAHLEYDCGEFSTSEDHPWTNPHVKTARRIDFSCHFITPPKVIVFFTQLDFKGQMSWRAKTYTSDIDVEGFTIHIDTWADTTLYSATAGWIAYPEDREHVFSGTASTNDIRPWNHPQLTQLKHVNFGNVEFWKYPSIFMAFNELDLNIRANLRLRCYADNISTQGFTWHIDSWADSVLYSAGISYLCVVW
ncbi:hypothetical protein FRB99_004421 [Tulasnella sp. 403]|nr:hypothetical protein FRB99_004421 [Tulasnella sp. 403]